MSNCIKRLLAESAVGQQQGEGAEHHKDTCSISHCAYEHMATAICRVITTHVLQNSIFKLWKPALDKRFNTCNFHTFQKQHREASILSLHDAVHVQQPLSVCLITSLAESALDYTL